MRAVFDLNTEVRSLKVSCDCLIFFGILWRNIFSLLGHLFSSAHIFLLKHLSCLTRIATKEAFLIHLRLWLVFQISIFSTFMLFKPCLNLFYLLLLITWLLPSRLPRMFISPWVQFSLSDFTSLHIPKSKLSDSRWILLTQQTESQFSPHFYLSYNSLYPGKQHIVLGGERWVESSMQRTVVFADCICIDRRIMAQRFMDQLPMPPDQCPLHLPFLFLRLQKVLSFVNLSS